MSTITGLLGRRLFPSNVDFGDIVQGLPVQDGTVDVIYASHVLEHIGRNEISQALGNTYRHLRRGGGVRLIVPDLEWRAKRYVIDCEKEASQAADDFIAACHIGQSIRPRGLMALLRSAYGNSGHMWMYDFKLMSELLSDAGFIDIRRCELHDSGDPMLEKVEDEGRFFDSGKPELAMEARKS